MPTHAYCGGTFDIFHCGHLRFFKWAKSNFDKVTVALNEDLFIEQYKETPPVQPFEERREILEGCRYIDNVVANIGNEDSKPAIRVVRPTHIVNGSDWSTERLMKQMSLTKKFLAYYQLTIVLCPLPREFSSTELKARVRR